MRIRKNQASVILWFFVFVFYIALPAYSDEGETPHKIPEIVVNAESIIDKQNDITLDPVGLAASVNVITSDDLKNMSVFDVTDIFRKVPGVSVFNYDQGDIGFGFQMRGFRSAGAKDTAVFVDGVPMNLVQGKINGWVDLDWLLPEMIERIEIVKGPFSALYGDFSLTGAINIITKKSDDTSISVSGGTYGTYGSVATISGTDTKFQPFLVLEGYNRDGYRDNSDYQRGQLFGKFTTPLWGGSLSTRIQYVTREWGVADYLPVNDVKSGLLEDTDTLDSSNEGDCEMMNLVVNYGPESGEQGLHATVFAESFENNQSFYFPPTPQMRFYDDRTRMGMKLLYNLVPYENFSLAVGNDTRYDDVDYDFKFSKSFSEIISEIESYGTQQFSTGFFAQAQYTPTDFLKLMGGLRYDYFDIDVDNHFDTANSGDCETDIFSPKIGMVVTPFNDINLFANYGTGFRSPAAWEVSPIGDPANFDLGVSELKSWDAGFNMLVMKKLFLGFDYYDTSLEREVAVNSATNTFENLGESTRRGVDIEARLYLPYDLELYGSYGYVHGRLDNPSSPGAVYIKSLPEDMMTLGFDWSHIINEKEKIGVNVYYVRYGERPMDTKNKEQSDPFDRYYAKVNYGIANWTISIEGQYTPDEYDSEWIYYSGGNLMYLPAPEFQGMAKLTYTF